MIRFSAKFPWARGEGRILHILLLTLYIINHSRIGGTPWQVKALFANVTLKTKNDDLSVVIYLPKDIKPGEPIYYQSSRFDWGSMIGSITRKRTNPNTGVKETHVLYGTNQWRLPHDPFWAESGVGLASEFGVGTNGAFCNFMCGWNQNNDVTNGVLGYQEAKSRESFLKIGVGELIKGSCNTCDSAEDYKFNSPYQFARSPVWTLEYGDDDDDGYGGNSIILSQEAVLDGQKFGYRLEKHITLNQDQLLVKSVLTNLGTKPFSTAWYSHHFFTCDAHPVQYGYSVDFDLASTKGVYDEPSTWSWSTPLENYAKVDVHNNTQGEAIRIKMQRGVESKVRIKAEFGKNEDSKGEFSLRACNTKIRETIPEVNDGTSGISMYAYNLYIESGTFSPEPQILLQLDPGQTKSWTQQLDFEDDYPIEPKVGSTPSGPLGSLVLQQNQSEPEEDSTKWRIAAITAISLSIAISSVVYRLILPSAIRTRGRKANYSLVPDATIECYSAYRDYLAENDAI